MSAVNMERCSSNDNNNNLSADKKANHNHDNNGHLDVVSGPLSSEESTSSTTTTNSNSSSAASNELIIVNNDTNNNNNNNNSTSSSAQDFIVKQLQQCAKDRLFMLNIEKDMTTYVNDSKSESFKFAAMNPYYRMLIHRIADYFLLGHHLDQAKQSVIVFKTPQTKMPLLSFQSIITSSNRDQQLSNNSSFAASNSGSSSASLTPNSSSPNLTSNSNNKESVATADPPTQSNAVSTAFPTKTKEQKKQILKREVNNKSENSSGHKSMNSKNVAQVKTKTFEEKHAEYNRIKNRIFNINDENSNASISSSATNNGNHEQEHLQQQQAPQYTILNRTNKTNKIAQNTHKPANNDSKKQPFNPNKSQQKRADAAGVAIGPNQSQLVAPSNNNNNNHMMYQNVPQAPPPLPTPSQSQTTHQPPANQQFNANFVYSPVQQTTQQQHQQQQQHHLYNNLMQQYSNSKNYAGYHHQPQISNDIQQQQQQHIQPYYFVSATPATAPSPYNQTAHSLNQPLITNNFNKPKPNTYYPGSLQQQQQQQYITDQLNSHQSHHQQNHQLVDPNSTNVYMNYAAANTQQFYQQQHSQMNMKTRNHQLFRMGPQAQPQLGQSYPSLQMVNPSQQLLLPNQLAAQHNQQQQFTSNHPPPPPPHLDLFVSSKIQSSLPVNQSQMIQSSGQQVVSYQENQPSFNHFSKSNQKFNSNKPNNTQQQQLVQNLSHLNLISSANHLMQGDTNNNNNNNNNGRNNTGNKYQAKPYNNNKLTQSSSFSNNHNQTIYPNFYFQQLQNQPALVHPPGPPAPSQPSHFNMFTSQQQPGQNQYQLNKSLKQNNSKFNGNMSTNNNATGKKYGKGQMNSYKNNYKKSNTTSLSHLNQSDDKDSPTLKADNTNLEEANNSNKSQLPESNANSIITVQVYNLKKDLTRKMIHDLLEPFNVTSIDFKLKKSIESNATSDLSEINSNATESNKTSNNKSSHGENFNDSSNSIVNEQNVQVLIHFESQEKLKKAFDVFNQSNSSLLNHNDNNNNGATSPKELPPFMLKQIRIY